MHPMPPPLATLALPALLCRLALPALPCRLLPPPTTRESDPPVADAGREDGREREEKSAALRDSCR